MNNRVFARGNTTQMRGESFGPYPIKEKRQGEGKNIELLQELKNIGCKSYFRHDQAKGEESEGVGARNQPKEKEKGKKGSLRLSKKKPGGKIPALREERIWEG